MEDRCRCSECGEFDWIEDMVYITDEDRYVCKACSSDLVGYCEWCQAFYSKDNVIAVVENLILKFLQKKETDEEKLFRIIFYRRFYVLQSSCFTP